VSFGASVFTSGGYQPTVSRPLFGGSGGGLNGSFTLTSRASATVGLQLSYQPLYALLLPTLPGSFNQAPGQVSELDPSNTARLNNHVSFQTNAGFSYRVAQHATFTASYGRQFSTANAATVVSRSLSTQTASGNLGIGLAKGLTLNLGYGFTNADYGTGATNVHGQNINVGINYSKPLSLSRRTSLSFTTGSTGVSNGGSPHWDIVGGVQLTHEIGRTWSASVGFSRNVSFLEGFTAPVLYDSAYASFGGTINRKLQFSSGGGTSIGGVGFGVPNNGFGSYFANAGLRFGLTRSLALSLNYVYSRYSFQSGVALPTSLLSHVNRQSVSVSINFWEPLFHRARR
jgi:hypothetical protein